MDDNLVSQRAGILTFSPSSMVFCNTSTSLVGGLSGTGKSRLMASRSGSMLGSNAFFLVTLGCLVFLHSHGIARRRYSW